MVVALEVSVAIVGQAMQRNVCALRHEKGSRFNHQTVERMFVETKPDWIALVRVQGQTTAGIFIPFLPVVRFMLRFLPV